MNNVGITKKYNILIKEYFWNIIIIYYNNYFKMNKINNIHLNWIVNILFYP